MATKTEGGVSYPASAYAYVPDSTMPSTWKLRINDANHTKAALAALGPSGFRGNRVQIPTKDLPAVKRKVAAAYRKFFPDNEVPNVLKSLDIQVEGQPIDGGLLGTVVEAMAEFFRMKQWKEQLLEDNSDFVEEMMGCEDCCPACGCDMSNVEGTVCPQCGCDVSKIPGYDGDGNDPEDNADQISEEPDENGNMVVKSLNEEQQKALFVVLSPDEVDLHGDTYSAIEIEKACESFNTQCRKANLFHASPTNDPVITQSFIAMDNFKTDSNIEIKKGAWLQWWSFPKDNETACTLWKAVKSGEINGVSVGCNATVEDIE